VSRALTEESDEVIPKLKSLVSADLEVGRIPPAPDDCRVLIEAEIGPADSEGADVFSFEVCTPKAFERDSGATWLKGTLLVESFDWKTVEQALQQYIMQCAGESWDEIASKLSRQLDWEFEDYQESIS
tara:strand:+ start:693 stop:1076 length:384 start_codon:yes stop_codon:yes gene_type:complete